LGDLDARQRERREAYLKAVTTPIESRGVARRRGYITGSRPAASWTNKLLAQEAASNHLRVWSEEPVLQAIVQDPWDDEDANVAVARLHTSPWVPLDVPFPGPNELPSLHGRGVPWRTLLRVLAMLGFTDRLSALRRVRDVIASARNGDDEPIFPADIIELVLRDLGDDDAPDNSQQPSRDGQVNSLMGLTIEDWLAPVDARAEWIIEGLYALLSSEAATSVAEATLTRGVSGTTLSHGGWDAILTLAWLGQFVNLPFHDGLLCVSEWLAPYEHGPEQPASCIPEWVLGRPPPPHFVPLPWSESTAFENLFSHRHDEKHGDRIWSWPSPEFVWPTYERSDVYWWRTIMMRHCLTHLFPLADTADFHANYVLRFFARFQSAPGIPAWLLVDIRLALTHFKYWLTERESPREEEMTFWSENHQILFATAATLAGQLLPNEDFGANRQHTVKGRDLALSAQARLHAWLDRRLRYGFSEWNAPGYYNEDFPPLFNLLDFCSDATIVRKASMVLDLLVFDLARFTCRGSFGTTAGRAYWEHKAYGWDQVVGDTIEILFGSRGTFMAKEESAVALATSAYDVPEVLLAIGLDRLAGDREEPFRDRSRVSVDLDEGAVGVSSLDDGVFWWGLMAYFAAETLDLTQRLVNAHPKLGATNPFRVLGYVSDSAFMQLIENALVAAGGMTAGGALLPAAAALPFPLNLAVGAVGLAALGAGLESIVGVLEDVTSFVASAFNAITNFLGITEDEPPKIPKSKLREVFEQMLSAFNAGSILSRANLVTYSNGDTLLASVQRHRVGQIAFQKHPWQATLDCEACVWTSSPLLAPELTSGANAFGRFLGDLAALRPTEALFDLPLPAVGLTQPFGHDGLTYWTGSLSLPFVAQDGAALIATYDMPSLQTASSAAMTHAWFPREKFSAWNQLDASGGTWTFGRKDEGFVALFSAVPVRWNEDHGSAWLGKELRADGSRNAWICVVGNEHEYGTYENFMQTVLASPLSIVGVRTARPLRCEFAAPAIVSGRVQRRRLAVEHATGVVTLDGDPLEADGFARFENRYVTSNPGGSVKWGARSYEIRHGPTGRFLRHDLSAATRIHGRDG
jgi:hypothetical protein